LRHRNKCGIAENILKMTAFTTDLELNFLERLIESTIIYTHIASRNKLGVVSPVDMLDF
jgi:hypothetical protein